MHLLGQTGSADVKMQATSIIAEILGSEEDEDVIHRVLVALGTLASDDAATVALCKDLDIPSALRRITGKGSAKSQAIAAELLQFLA